MYHHVMRTCQGPLRQTDSLHVASGDEPGLDMQHYCRDGLLPSNNKLARLSLFMCANLALL